jgi:hypothetical protein
VIELICIHRADDAQIVGDFVQARNGVGISTPKAVLGELRRAEASVHRR